MSKLNIIIDYIKLAQYVQMAKHYIAKIEHELEEAAMDRRDKRMLYCSDFDCLNRDCDDEKMVE